jgi:replication initiation and membrane attachment protein DnaB
MKEKLEQKLGKEKYQQLEQFLKSVNLDVTGFYKLKPEERITTVAKFCQQYNYDFTEIYSCVEAAKDETMKEHALRAAAAAILARDGPAAINDLNLYSKIQEKIKEEK